MANRAKKYNKLNRIRQKMYLEKGIVMLPTKREEVQIILRKNGVQAT